MPVSSAIDPNLHLFLLCKNDPYIVALFLSQHLIIDEL